MSEMGDDDLLNDEEFDYEDYDITNEKEDALLQDEESNHLPEHEEHEDHSDKKESEDDNEEDVLDLDYEAEEDLEDVEDKPSVTQSSEQRQYRKFVSENEKSSSDNSNNTNNTTHKVISPQIVKKNFPGNNNKQVPPTSTKPNTQSSIKKAPPKFERRRGGGGGRGNFQNRPNFLRNNNIQKGRQERRNGKVYINPKYEGIVPVNESNGRLAWDNSNFAPPSNPQNIQPWVANATLQFDFQDPARIITNLVSNLANHSALQIPQPQIQNTFEPPQQVPQVFQHNNLAFQPPPNTAPMQTYSGQNQVSGRQPFPPQMSPLLPTPQRFSNLPVNRMQEGPKPFNSYSDTSNYYDRPNTQHTYPQDLKKDYPPTSFQSRNTNNMTSYNKTFINNNKSDWYDYGTNRTDTFKTESFSNSGLSEPNDFTMKAPSYGSYYQRKNSGNNFPPKTAYSSTFTNDYATKSSLYKNDTSYQSRYQLPPTDLFAKSYTAGKVEDHNKNLNPTLKTGDTNRRPMTFAPSKLGDNRSNQSLYNAPRRQDLSNDYSKRMNYSSLEHNNSTKLDNYQSLSYDNKPEEQKQVYSNYSSARPDQDQRYYNRKEEHIKPNYDNRNNFYGNRNYTNQNDHMQESPNSVNFKNNWSQNKSYNRNVQNSSSPNNRRTISNEISDIKVELPIKRMKSSEEETAKKIGIKAEATPAHNKIVMEEEDEETKVYRMKIEEQKKQREKILQMKEERRKQALQEAKKEEMAAQKLENKPQDLLKMVPIAPIPNYQKKQQINSIPVLSAQPAAKPSSDKLSLTFNIQNDLQTTNAGASQKSESSGFMSNRVVLVKNSQKGASSTNSSSNVVKTVPVIESGNETNDVGQNISSFFNNRKVLKKDSNLINTRLVVVNNLSASTSENKLVSMTKGIGEIQKLRMDRQERQATILFKTVASAHAFFKKYQRHMLDLSMIEVRLENML